MSKVLVVGKYVAAWVRLRAVPVCNARIVYRPWLRVFAVVDVHSQQQQEAVNSDDEVNSVSRRVRITKDSAFRLAREVSILRMRNERHSFGENSEKIGSLAWHKTTKVFFVASKQALTTHTVRWYLERESSSWSRSCRNPHTFGGKVDKPCQRGNRLTAPSCSNNVSYPLFGGVNESCSNHLVSV